MNILFQFMVVAFTSTQAFAVADPSIWSFIGSDQQPVSDIDQELPAEYSLFKFNRDAFLQSVESSASTANRDIFLPLPNGSLALFQFFDAEVMHPDLASQFSEIKTFAGDGSDNSGDRARFDISPEGFHGQLQLTSGLAYISPLSNDVYIVFYAQNYRPNFTFNCENNENGTMRQLDDAIRPSISYGTTLRTYRFAVATTGEYTAAVGGTKVLALATIVTAVNFINAIYETEVGVRLQLIPNNINIIYTNAASDPYTPASGNTALLAQNQTNTDAVIGSANYDIGHVLHALGGSSNSGSGVATLQSTCRSTSKARGVTTASRIGLLPMNPFFYRIFIHELGHQFGAQHSYNSSCGGNRSDPSAYEPGGGSTIMSYAGGCSPYNVQTLADTYFHRISLEQIAAFRAGFGSTCGVLTNTLNAVPTAEAGLNYVIPRLTPFVLTGVGTDANLLNILTYTWEQYNNEIAPMPPLATSTVGPNFRSFLPTTSPSRYFPRLADVRANVSPIWEVLPSVGRTMNFSLVVRDGVGGAASDNMSVTVNAASGPFLVRSPNGGESVAGNVVVAWAPANTAAPPVNAPLVDILLSIDNGQTFPIMLANNTPNDGTQTVSMPRILTTSARVQVRAEGNIFYDMSNGPFSIRLIANEE